VRDVVENWRTRSVTTDMVFLPTRLGRPVTRELQAPPCARYKYVSAGLRKGRDPDLQQASRRPGKSPPHGKKIAAERLPSGFGFELTKIAFT